MINIEDIYNSRDDVERYIVDLKTLHEIKEVRHKKGYEENERMKEFKILDDFIWFDSCGNTLVKVWKDGYSPITIPYEDSECPVCGRGWNVHNIKDYVLYRDYKNGKVDFYHKQCNFINNLNEVQDQFIKIFSWVYGSNYSFKVIPNEYSDAYVYAPWFIFSTPDGDIKIGWRKRVINIQWLPSYRKFTETFDEENVTKVFNSDRRFIHAWTVEKCFEYLQRARNSIVKEDFEL